MSLTSLADLVVLLLVLATTAIVLLGWGNLIWRFLGIEQPNRPSVVTVWLGFCIVLAFLEFAHLFIQLDWRVTTAVAMTGIAEQVWRALSRIKTGLQSTQNTRTPTELLNLTFNACRRNAFRSAIATIVIVAWCLRAFEAPVMYDSGLYHFGSIRWLNEYPIVPGLGNVHWRLALNQSYFGFLAILNFAPYWDKGYAIGGLFLLILTAYTLFEIGCKQSLKWRWIFGAPLFAYLCLASGSISNPMPDTAVAMLQIVIFIFLYISLTTISTPDLESQFKRQRILIVLTFMCVMSVTIKLSSVGYSAAILLVITIKIVRGNFDKFSPRLLIKLISLLSIITLVHVARGYLLSGAPFFPSPIGGVWSLPWAVELGVAQNESQLIYAWAKQPGISSASELDAGFSWLSRWFESLPWTAVFLFGYSTLLLIVSSITAWSMTRVAQSSYQFELILPILMAFGFWFFTAPDLRFLGAMPVIYFVLTTWFSVQALSQINGLTELVTRLQIHQALKICGAMVLIFLFCRWVVLGLKVVDWASVPAVEVQKKTTDSGLVGYVPRTGAQCWAAPLPCAVLLHDRLRIHPSQASGEEQISTLKRFIFTTR